MSLFLQHLLKALCGTGALDQSYGMYEHQLFLLERILMRQYSRLLQYSGFTTMHMHRTLFVIYDEPYIQLMKELRILER